MNINQNNKLNKELKIMKKECLIKHNRMKALEQFLKKHWIIYIQPHPCLI